ncbi:hypothetical protein FGG08_006162 [Glutinoglossum americanum]|uniref:Protein kinase domain-containing protein n=1 Tax=Glutinoglossum americanum TaxID=1670608 RepID=A0A9P8L273_9PEZI|nr:hypothetical protein FGG08_006162 [Glutinoglossum americanum]
MLFPIIPGDQLDIKVISPLAHGGHSFVFKVSTNRGTGVLKIFRFPNGRDGEIPEVPDPYLYFNREVEAYSRLIEQGATFCPRVISTVLISAKEEQSLRAHMKTYWIHLYRRGLKATQEELPLKALLMELVNGERLTGLDLLSDSILQEELRRAVEEMHACGVAWRDAKWRNILVRSSTTESTAQSDSDSNRVLREAQTKCLTLLDYSNACCQPPLKYVEEEIPSAATTKEEWETIRRNEYEVVQHMIKFGRVGCVTILQRCLRPSNIYCEQVPKSSTNNTAAQEQHTAEVS